MARVFISYRRVDSKWAVGRLYDRLSEVLDRKNIFLDVNDIEPGEDYTERIKEIVSTCDVLLAVIGREWLTSQDSSGRRRLDDPRDWVRVEIASALARGIRVIPVLIDEAEMPERHALPDDLARLAHLNAKLVSFTRFHADLDSLLRVLEKVLCLPSEPTALRLGPDTVANETADSPLSGNSRKREMPMTISLETLGGIATPLIYRGTRLPTEESQVFSTVEDNQPAVTVKLVWGQREKAEDNLFLGRFNLEGIPPAKRGVPQIKVLTAVDENLLMTVTARDKGTGRIEVLDAVDLSHVEIPEDMQKEALEQPRRKESNRDFFSNLSLDEVLGDVFGCPTARGKSTLDVERVVHIGQDDATRGVATEVTNGEGKSIKVKIRPGTKDRQKYRVTRQGKSLGFMRGDLYVEVRITDTGS